MTRSKNVSYLPGVDHLRAFAALLIVLYHGAQQFESAELARLHRGRRAWPVVQDLLSALIHEGHTAVALFMVLSGFIFTHSIGDQSVDYRRFLKNRFLRTYPLFVVLIVVGACTLPKAVNIESVLHTLLGLANYQKGALQVPPFSGMFWTIAVEWQFYVVFPFLLHYLRGAPLSRAFGILMIALVCRFLSYSAGADARDMAYWTILGRIDQFVLGMVAGLLYRRLSPKSLRLVLAPAVASALGSLYFFNHAGGWPASGPLKLFWPTWEGAVWVSVLASYVAVADRLPSIVSAPLTQVGMVSYSVYLWHWPIVWIASTKDWTFHVLPNLQDNALLNTVVLAAPVILAFSFLSYHVIEKPFLALRVRYLTPGDNGGESSHEEQSDTEGTSQNGSVRAA